MPRLPFFGAALMAAAGLTAAAPPGEAGLQTNIPLAQELLRLLADPNVTYVLLVIGLLGVVAEIVTAGTGVPGLIGVVALVLALVGLGQLPTNWAGFVLILVAVMLFLVDIKVPGHALSVGGVLAFVLGSLLLFTPFWLVGDGAVTLSPWVILGTSISVGAFFLLGVAAGLAAQSAPLSMGSETLMGRSGTVRTPLVPRGQVHLEGEEWSAVSRDGSPIATGTPVRVVGIDGLALLVEPLGETTES